MRIMQPKNPDEGEAGDPDLRLTEQQQQSAACPHRFAVDSEQMEAEGESRNHFLF